MSLKTMAALRPLTMDQIAQKVGVHNTTVSRTVRDKYMSTPFGVVEMRKFFTAGLSMEGGEALSHE
ncbi:MAG: RNA polymerase sigma-54 factor, partial [Clostridia bacterium]|nr:RNA polymerase sigma-54 factor [Clostridia bacterium]